jgi:hypothetical protein
MEGPAGRLRNILTSQYLSLKIFSRLRFCIMLLYPASTTAVLLWYDTIYGLNATFKLEWINNLG